MTITDSQMDRAELAMFRKTVRGYIETYLKPLEDQTEENDAVDHEAAERAKQKAIELGIYAYNVPTDLGGPGLSVPAQLMVSEELGRTSQGLHWIVGYPPLSVLRAATPEQRPWLVDPLVQGAKRSCSGYTEAQSGSDWSQMKTHADPHGNGWVINGQKQFVSFADIADLIFVATVTNPSAPPKERYTFFVVEKDNPGFTITQRYKTMGWRGHHLSAFTLEDCYVPADHVIGEVHGGFKTMTAGVNAARVKIAAGCIGTAEMLLIMACEWAAARVTSGKPIAEHQAIQFMIADMDLELTMARLLVDEAGRMIEEDDPEARIASSRAKLFGSEMACRVADKVMQIFGASGFTTDLIVERAYRDLRGFRIGEGSSEIQRIQIGRHAVKTRSGR